MAGQAAIRVNYRLIDGYHVYTSDDVYGLYVANRDAQAAYDAVGPSLEKLITLNEKIDCRVEPAILAAARSATRAHKVTARTALETDIWRAITPRMVEAGIDLLSSFDRGVDSGYLLVAEIYVAMEVERLRSATGSHESHERLTEFDKMCRIKIEGMLRESQVG